MIRKEFTHITTTEDLWKYFSESRKKKGISSPIYFAVYDDLKDPLNYTIYFGQSGLGLPGRDYYPLDQPHYIKGREEAILNIFQIFLIYLVWITRTKEHQMLSM